MGFINRLEKNLLKLYFIILNFSKYLYQVFNTNILTKNLDLIKVIFLKVKNNLLISQF